MSSSVSQSKLPSYKSSNLRQQTSNSNGSYQMKPPVTTSTIPQTKLPTPTKPSPLKEYKDEIEKLKKELSTIKAENSILKAKVRRVDDENLQKGRQIEKMRTEIKSLQKNESGSLRKNRESQELLSLRQKCLRLENALKDKDLTIKRLHSELSMKKDNSESAKTPPYAHKQMYQVTASQLKNSSKGNEKESISAKSSLSRASLSLKTEVTKLRDMIHKLEKENQDLQQQAKLYCQEIRRLKIQMKSKVTIPQTSASKSNNAENLKNIKNKSVSTVNNQDPQTKSNSVHSFPSKQRLVKNSKSSSQVQMTPKLSVPQKSNLPKNISKSERSLSAGKAKQLPDNNQAKGIKSKLPVTRPSLIKGAKPEVKKSVTNKSLIKNITTNSDLEHKVQEMRENIAAKKIQRSWRHHQKCLQHSPDFEFRNGGKALTFIISSMKHHKLRKDKLSILVKKNHMPESIKQETLMEAIESISKKVWDQGISTS